MIGASRASSTRSYQLLATTTITSTGSQSATVPAGTLFIEIECWGAGGGGAGRTQITAGKITTYYGQSGGGAGAYLKKKYQISNMQVNDTLNFTIGAAGSGGPVSTNGGAGGNTTLDTHKRSATTITTFSVSAGGGVGAVASTGFFAATSGGSASGGDTNTSGGNATAGGGAGGDGGAGGTAPNGGAGGAGGVKSSNAIAQDGVSPGGGGGGARGENVNGVGNLGGDGANGKVIVKYYG